MLHPLKAIISILLVLAGFASCRSAWNQTDEQSFYKACVNDAKTWAGTPEQAAAYCNCIIPKIKAKYPDENEAMKQVNLLSSDKDLQACRDSLKK